MLQLPWYIPVLFIFTLLTTIIIFYKATQNSKLVAVVIAGWIALQTTLSLSGFYTVTNGVPPRFLLLAGPPLMTIIILFISKKGWSFIDGLDINMLTLLHVVRIPVEFVLLFLSVEKTVPVLMTFEGRNFDIISGITAVFIFLLIKKDKKKYRHILLSWNVICLGLLINIVTNAVLAAPSPFQRFAFDQPAVAILYFPFVLLPAVIVPLVLLSHLSAIRQLLTQKKNG